MSRVKIACASLAVALAATSSHARTSAPDVVIPFQLVVKHVVVPVTVDGSKPLSFVLDTGDKYGVIDMNRAKELGVKLGAAVNVGGAGSQTMQGAMVQGSTLSLPGLTGFAEPVVIAIPLGSLAAKLGCDFDGIIGADFISQFVVEIDYQAKQLVLHDRDAFTYSGPGTSVPMKLNAQGHPTIGATVAPVGGVGIAATFIVDVGSSMPLALYSPFVKAHQLPGAGVKTIPSIGGAGTGGDITGLVGRVDGITIGASTVKTPVTLFSSDQTGAFANDELTGNIGEPVLSYFKLFLDYAHNRMIFEPAKPLDVPFDRVYSGMVVESEGADHKTFRVTNLLENSPATDVKIQKGDIITALDGREASALTLSEMLEMFEKPATYKLTIRRGDEILNVSLTTRKLV